MDLATLAGLAVVGVGLVGCTIVTAPKPAPESATSAVDGSQRREVLDQRRILVFGDVTTALAERVIRDLFYLDARSDLPIDLYLMTPGGDLKAAFAIENALQLVRSPVNTYAFAECNSAGAMLLAAGTGKRFAFRGATVVIHGMLVRGRPPAEFVGLTQDYYTEFWRRRARLPAEWLPIPRGQTRFLTAERALQYGVVDELLDRRALPRELMPHSLKDNAGR